MSNTASGAPRDSRTATSDAGVDADEQCERAARQYVEQLRVFRIHAAVFAAGMILVFGVNLVTNLASGIAGHWWAWWSAWALIGWGIGVAVHSVDGPFDHRVAARRAVGGTATRRNVLVAFVP